MDLGLLWNCICLSLVILVLGNIEALQIHPSRCNLITKNAKQQKFNLFNQVIAYIDSTNKVLSEFFQVNFELQDDMDEWDYYMPQLETRKNQIKRQIYGIEDNFVFEMGILNETLNIQNETNTQKNLLDKYFDLKVNMLHKFDLIRRKINYTYGSFDIENMTNKTNCNLPCKSPCKYAQCFKREINLLIGEFNSLKQDYKNYTDEIEYIKQINPNDLDILKNVNKIAQEKRLTVKNLTAQILRDYYQNKLIVHHKEFMGRSEAYHNSLITTNLKSGGTTLLKIVTFARDKLKPQYVPSVDPKCNYLNILNGIINTTNTTISLYNRFPLWDLEDFTTKHSRSTKNVTNVYKLLDIYKTAFDNALMDIRSIYPTRGFSFTYPQYSMADFKIAVSFNELDAKWTLCPAFTINNADDQTAYNILSCLISIPKNEKITIMSYLQFGLDDSQQIEKCFNETKKP